MKSGKKLQNKKMIKVDPNMNMQEFILTYPQLVDVLMYEFGFHCVNCIFAGMDTIKEGAAIHQIEGEEFDEMIEYIEDYLNDPENQVEILTN